MLGGAAPSQEALPAGAEPAVTPADKADPVVDAELDALKAELGNL
jgi:hypothetical protein